MEKEIKEKNIIGGIGLIENPELIKVKVIKGKYVEQMSPLSMPELESKKVEIVGRTRIHVIFRTETGEFKKFHNLDMMVYLRKEMMLKNPTIIDMREATPMANQEYERIPFIFEE